MKGRNSYGMFSSYGDKKVARIVKHSETWAEIYDKLRELSNDPRCGESCDTAVREAIWWRHFMTKEEKTLVLDAD